MTFLGNSYRALRVLPWVAAGAGALLLTVAMPGVNFAEGAWFWAVPFLLWAAARPGWRQWLGFSFGAMWGVKIATLVWLRHVYPPLGWLGLVLLTAYLALFPLAWLALARWLFPRMTGAGAAARIVAQLGLAGAWVTLEWLQGWLLSGFPWGLLAETQWQRPPVLALGQIGGPWAVGFVIILFNVGIARYVLRFAEERERAEAERLRALNAAAAARMAGANGGGAANAAANADVGGGAAAAGRWSPAAVRASAGAGGALSVFRRMCPEFYVGILPVFAAFYVFVESGRYLAERSETLFSVAMVQTDFDPNAKWSEARRVDNLFALHRLTRAALRLTPKEPVFEMPAKDGVVLPVEMADAPAAPPDVLLWPEAATQELVHTPGYDGFIRDQLSGTRTVLIGGGISTKGAPPPASSGERPGYYNMIFTADAARGPASEFYGKRHLVPFGEYIPGFAAALGLRKVVPVSQDCLRGTRDAPLPVRIGGWNAGDAGNADGGNGDGGGAGGKRRVLHAGVLVCYEDVFPDLALAHARPAAGADNADGAADKEDGDATTNGASPTPNQRIRLRKKTVAANAAVVSSPRAPAVSQAGETPALHTSAAARNTGETPAPLAAAAATPAAAAAADLPSAPVATHGADFLCVLTNDAWYGREAGAYQHAAHSAVLAAALRLPVIRCGNNGWSGVFTPSGHALPLRNAGGSIYFRGAGRFEVKGVPAALRQPTFYERNGNWLVLCSSLLFVWAVLRHLPILRKTAARRRRAD